MLFAFWRLHLDVVQASGQLLREYPFKFVVARQSFKGLFLDVLSDRIPEADPKRSGLFCVETQV